MMQSAILAIMASWAAGSGFVTSLAAITISAQSAAAEVIPLSSKV
jgi:hypothetical protein